MKAAYKKSPEPINIIFMRKFGRIYSTDVSGRMLLLLFFFLLAFTAISILVINRYVDLYLENQDLKTDLSYAKRALQDYRRQSLVLSQYTQLVNQLNQAARKDETITAPKPADEAMEDIATIKLPRPVETPPVVIAADGPANPSLDAAKLILKPEGQKSLLYQFDLKIILPGNKPVSGFLFLILTNPNLKPPPVLTYPEVRLVQGNPADFKKGEPFNIRQFKQFKGRIDNLPQASSYTQAWILAYSETGELLLKKLLASENV